MKAKTEFTVIEKVERKALAWTFGSKIQQSFKGSLVDFTTISLSELDVVLLFAKILTGKVDMDWHKYVSLTNIGANTSFCEHKSAKTRNLPLKKYESDFLDASL